MKVGEKSKQKYPSIKSFYYTGGSGHESHTNHGDVLDTVTTYSTQAEAEAAAPGFGCTGAHQMGDLWMVCSDMSEMSSDESLDVPTIEASLNTKQRLTSLNGTFIDLSSDVDDRGYGTVIGQLEDGRQYAYYINEDTVQTGLNNVFANERISLTPGEKVEGTSSDDDLVGTKGNDTINGKSGLDTLTGNHGDDTLRGKKGNDSLHGRRDNDLLIGGSGNDRLAGGMGTNTLKGGAGSDTFVIGHGKDTIEDLDLDSDTIESVSEYVDIVSIDGGNNSQILFSKETHIATIIGINADELKSSGVIQSV